MRFGTKVGAVLCAAHQNFRGHVHGHTWQVWATCERRDAVALQEDLKALLATLDHGVLPRELSEGEDLAAFVGERLNGCFRVDVCRPMEMIEAWWER